MHFIGVYEINSYLCTDFTGEESAKQLSYDRREDNTSGTGCNEGTLVVFVSNNVPHLAYKHYNQSRIQSLNKGRGGVRHLCTLDILIVPDKSQHFSLFTLSGMYED